jgi:hypothetical protein
MPVLTGTLLKKITSVDGGSGITMVISAVQGAQGKSNPRFLSILSIKRPNWLYRADRADAVDRAENAVIAFAYAVSVQMERLTRKMQNVARSNPFLSDMDTFLNHPSPYSCIFFLKLSGRMSVHTSLM